MSVLKASRTHPPLGSLIVASATKKEFSKIDWGTETKLVLGPNILSYDSTIIRYLASGTPFYDSDDVLKQVEIDHWITFPLGTLECSQKVSAGIDYLNQVLEPVTYLVGDSVTAADYAVYGYLYTNDFWKDLLKNNKAPKNLKRWFDFIGTLQPVQKTVQKFSGEFRTSDTSASSKPKESKKKEDVGKFVDLPGAEMGKVIVRFPPEASGYLHIGHAKAVLLNAHYQKSFQGKLILRFDDTNPAKEKEEYENVIMDDLKSLGVKYDYFSRTSDHFETLLLYCERLIKERKAYVDDTDNETMKAERESRTESRNRNASTEQNMKLWVEMKNGSEMGLKCCVRAKIDMSSNNGALRDPTIYRCKPESHPSTGNKFKVYPTYDFACPIVDSIEGVTHTLRTTEYMDRDDQFFWFIDALGLRRPHIYAYSRLSLTHTVMSKRKLTWFVESKIVDGWDDPRFPTVRGVLRRGLTVEALTNFILAQGSSRSVVFMEWDKIWAFNKKVIDPVAPRYSTVIKENSVRANLEGITTDETIEVEKHPKNPEVGKKKLRKGPSILIDHDDAQALKVGDKITLINWGNVSVLNVTKSSKGFIECVDLQPMFEDKDYKKTLKVTWLCDSLDPLIPTLCVYYDHLISKPVLDKNDDFKSYIKSDTVTEIAHFGDQDFAKLKVKDIIQIQRRGYFIVDKAYSPPTRYSTKPEPIVLIAIPDGTPTSYGPPKSLANTSELKQKQSSPSSSKNVSFASDSVELNDKIVAQGNKVRELKAASAAKPVLDAQVKVLLDLKKKFKEVTGSDWKPDLNKRSNNNDSSKNASELDSLIQKQGNLVRDLKAQKADKSSIQPAVELLLQYKSQFKSVTGNDWKPGSTMPPATAVDVAELTSKIVNQGNLVRDLKSKKASKPEIDSAVSILLKLKDDYKKATNEIYKPPSSSGSIDDLNKKITSQGDLIRELKSKKANKSAIDSEVTILLALKQEFKKMNNGKEWKPQTSSNEKPKDINLGNALNEDITIQGNKVRVLKAEKADKESIETAVNILLGLKEKYKSVTGTDWAPKQPTKNAPQKKSPKPQQAPKPSESSSQKVTRLGLEAKKAENFPDWYSQVITKSEMLEYYDISGCYVLRPWSYSIWESIQQFFDKKIKNLGVQNCYFPIFLSKASLQKEKDHIDDFSPEVAWVTKSGDTDMAEPIAIRPTSETVMYPTFAKWIQSHRDLPLKTNQWCNVVRWEFKHPQPFLRTREFLWQEGHTAYSNFKDAKEEVMVILDFYREIYEDLLAVPVIRGKKTEKEKFAGGDFTTTVEAYIGTSGRAIQGATSHHLGQNFSKMFDIVFEDPKSGNKEYVYQNSWGITTRTIGVLTMVHGDDTGLVMPPNISPIQIVIVPCGITASLKDADRKILYDKCEEYESALNKLGLRVKGDYRENVSPGWKFNHWELKGVPLRLELGPKDIKQGVFVLVRRDTLEKSTVQSIEEVPSLLKKIQESMFEKAKKERDSHLSLVKNWNDFLKALKNKHLIHAPFCGDKDCEENIKDKSKGDADVDPGEPSMGAKSLCIPFDQPTQLDKKDKCIGPGCSKSPQFFTLFGRSY